MAFEVYTSSISSHNLAWLFPFFSLPYGPLGTCGLGISDSVAIMGLMTFIVVSFAILSLHRRKWSESVTSTHVRGDSYDHAAGRIIGNRLSHTLDTLSSLLQILLAKRVSLPPPTSVARMKHLLLIFMLFLPTSVEGHNNTASNADVLRWIKTAPKAVEKNFRITLSNEIVFHSGLSSAFFDPLPLPPRFPFHLPFPRCLLVDCCPGCPGHPEPGDLFEWIRTTPFGIRQNFEISVIFKDTPRGSLSSRETDSSNEVLIRRLWVAAFVD